MDVTLRVLLSRVVAAALFVAVMAGSWDAWWHLAVGRDTFWEPPHLLLYSAVTVAIAVGAYGWYRTREKTWWRLAILLVLAPLSAPFDELWHRLFGVEDLSSPLVIWSPPHVALVAAVMGSLILALFLIREDRDVHAQRLFSSLAFAGILWLCFLLIDPLRPIGPWRVIGFWGAGIVAAVFVIILIAQGWMPGLGGGTLAAMFFIPLITSELHGETIAPELVIPPHDHPPVWLMIFSFLLPAATLDIIKQPPLWISGALGGVLLGGIFYGFLPRFLEPEFQYGTDKAITAIVASTLGGLVAGLAVDRFVIRSAHRAKSE